MFTFYFAPNSCALASHIALKDAGADYTPRRVDFGKAEQQSPDYLGINPKGRVPALVTPRGVLTETPAMLAFIAQSFPKAGLAPLDDPRSPSPRCRRSTATCAPRSMSRMRMAGAARGGPARRRRWKT